MNYWIGMFSFFFCNHLSKLLQFFKALDVINFFPSVKNPFSNVSSNEQAFAEY